MRLSISASSDAKTLTPVTSQHWRQWRHSDAKTLTPVTSQWRQDIKIWASTPWLFYTNVRIQTRNSKPGRLLPNPGFGFGRPQTRVSGLVSGFATLKCRRQVDDVYGVYQVRELCGNASIDPYYDAASHAEERMIYHYSITSHRSSFSSSVLIQSQT